VVIRNKTKSKEERKKEAWVEGSDPLISSRLDLVIFLGPQSDASTSALLLTDRGLYLSTQIEASYHSASLGSLGSIWSPQPFLCQFPSRQTLTTSKLELDWSVRCLQGLFSTISPPLGKTMEHRLGPSTLRLTQRGNGENWRWEMKQKMSFLTQNERIIVGHTHAKKERVLKDLWWCICHHSSMEKSAGLIDFGLSPGARFDSGRKRDNSNKDGFEHLDPQAKVLNYCFQ